MAHHLKKYETRPEKLFRYETSDSIFYLHLYHKSWWLSYTFQISQIADLKFLEE